jgi:pimeloyl-ACP methyl ester carboxylesterase
MQSPPADADYIAKGFAYVDQRERAMAVYDELRGELLAFDARKLGRKFDCPIFFIQGSEDAYSVTSEVADYAAWIETPLKRVLIVEGGGHSCWFLREPFLELLNAHVRSPSSPA